MMDCRETRRVLWPADILRVSDADVERALEHAETCEGCGKFLEQDRRVARLIHDAVPRVRTPRELRERLYTALARERAGPATARATGRRRTGRWLAVGALIVAGVALSATGHWLVGLGRAAPPAAAFAEDYLRRVVEQQELQSTDRQEIASFFAREIGVNVPPPAVPEYEVERATICLMNGRRGGVVEYRADGRQFSYYVLPLGRGGAGLRGGVDVRLVASDGGWFPAVGRERGLGVATWWDGKYQHALVGNLPVGELKQLAPLFTAPTFRP